MLEIVENRIETLISIMWNTTDVLNIQVYFALSSN